MTNRVYLLLRVRACGTVGDMRLTPEQAEQIAQRIFDAVLLRPYSQVSSFENDGA